MLPALVAPALIALRTGATTVARFAISADGLPLTVAALQACHIFGGPFSGKTTLVEGIQDGPIGQDHKVFVAEYDTEMKKQEGYTPSINRAWRPDHPDHQKWVILHRRVLSVLEQARRNGGISIAHDPRPDTEVDRDKQLLLYPAPSELGKRAEEYRHIASPESYASRISAAKHWGYKFAQRGWANQYRLLSFERVA